MLSSSITCYTKILCERKGWWMWRASLLSYIKEPPQSHSLQHPPPPPVVSSHWHGGSTIKMVTAHWSLSWRWAFFNNKVFLIMVRTLLLDICYCTLNRLKYNKNMTFICMEKPKKYLCDLCYWDIHFITMGWNQTHNISKVLTFLPKYLHPCSFIL